MKFVALYGPPAVGKLTVAKEVSRLTGIRLFHNHLTWNAVNAVFEWGTEPFVRSLPEIRRVIFREAARANRDLLFTYVFSLKKASLSKTYFDSVEDNGGTVCLVRLTAPYEVLERRVTEASRSEVGKMHTVKEIQEYFHKVTDLGHSIPGRQSLDISTDKLSAEEAANQIIEHYSLADLTL